MECLSAHKLEGIADKSSVDLSSGILQILVEYLVGVVGLLVRLFNESEFKHIYFRRFTHHNGLGRLGYLSIF